MSHQAHTCAQHSRSIKSALSSGRALMIRRRGPHERPEEAVLLVIGARGEEEGIGRTVVGGALAEAERPEALDGDRRPFGGVKRAAVLELAVAFQPPGVEAVNAPVAEVADE